jgi:hypothetical protein
VERGKAGNGLRLVCGELRLVVWVRFLACQSDEECIAVGHGFAGNGRQVRKYPAGIDFMAGQKVSNKWKKFAHIGVAAYAYTLLILLALK